MRKSTIAVLGIIGLLALQAGIASATSVTATFTGIGPSGGVGVRVYYTPDTGSPVTENTIAGVYNWTQVGTQNPLIPKTFGTFCIDAEGTIYLGSTYTWNVLAGKSEIVNDAPSRTPPGGAIQDEQYDRILKLFALYFNPDDGTWTNTEAAAFGAAIWELVWESPDGDLPSAYDVDDDLLRVYNNSSVTDRAQIMLDDVMTSSVVPDGMLYALINTTSGQDQMLAFGVGETPPAVPEPLTLLALSSGVIGLAGYVRKRRLA